MIRRYPAFHGQRGLWFLHGLAAESAAYNVMSAWRIRSRVDVDALRYACVDVTDRNDSLRTTYRVVNGALMAEVRDPGDPLVLVDASGWHPEKLLGRVSDEAHRPFDIESGPVSRAMLFTTSPEDHILLISAHHIAVDGWSNRIIMKELGALYDAHAAGLRPSLRPPGPSCEEFARWQAELLAGSARESLCSYWCEQLAGSQARLDLPADRPRKQTRRYHGDSETVLLDGKLTSALRRLASSHGTTPFVVLLSAFQVLLARYTGQNDIVVGSIAHGRTVPRFRRTVGNLMNHVVLRADFSGDPSFTDHLHRARETVRAALAHQDYPFSLLVKRLAPVRSPGRSALFDVTFGLTYLIGEGRATFDCGRLSLTAVPLPRRASQNDLDVQLVESEHGLSAIFQFDTDLFEAATIQRMVERYTTLLAAFADDPSRCVWDGALFTAPERAPVLVERTRTEADTPRPAWVQGPIEAQADRTLAAATAPPGSSGGTISLPRTGIEETLARILESVLERSHVSVHDNFFDLGGHSLLAIQVISRIQETLQVRLTVRDLFEVPTVAGLAERIATWVRDGSTAPTAAIEPRGRTGAALLSFSQERMWFLHQLSPESAAYNVPVSIRVHGSVNVGVLVAALREIVRRHEILRAVFPVIDGRPVQVVTDHRLDLPLVNLQMLPAGSREARARELCREEARRPFDLERGPVLRALLLRLDPGDHVILLTMHHIVCDQWSCRVLGNELLSLYDAYSTGQPSPLKPLRLQFADFASWQRQWLSGPALEVQLAYWRRHLGGTLPVLDLPADRPRPARPSYNGGSETRLLTRTLASAVEALSRQEKASVFMTLMAGFTALLGRYAGQDDILLGVPIANRNHLASEDLIGNLVNTLPLRTDLSGDPTFRQHLRRVRDTLLDAYAHQDMPFDKLVLELQPKRYASHSPLVQVLVNLLNVPMPHRSPAGLAWEPFPFDPGTAQFDLTLTVDWAHEAWVTLEYSLDLFDQPTAARIVDDLELILRGAVAEPDHRLSAVPLVAPGDREQLLVTWNHTVVPGSVDTPIHELFEVQADRTPDAVAVINPEGSMTYRELDRQANRLARHLQACGVGPETTVGVCLDRSRLAFVALLAVLKAGGAFVPLDPGYPSERVAFMLADSGALVLVSTQQRVPRIVPAGVQVVLLDSDREVIARQSSARIAGAVGGDRLAYVIYTSGSTGTPKGVLGLHRGAVNRFRWMWRRYPFRSDEVCCQKTSMSFVDSIWEIFGPLLQGVPIVTISDKAVRDPRRLIQMLAEHRVTRIVLVPSLLRAMVEVAPDLGARLPHLSFWVSSGEALGRDLVRRFREGVPRGVLLNLYGSSEVSGDSTFHEVGDGDAIATVPIGRPIDNTKIYILDRRQQPVPIGVAGELYIGGAGLARGYLGRPDLTAEKFVPDSFSGGPGARMYRTGDWARYRSDGTIEYLGRLDSQVKARGFRIELSEVECALAAHPSVAKAIVVAREDGTGDRRLVGYVVAKKGSESVDILRFARQRVPDYMVPSALVLMDALPLTPNGKVDRRALPEPSTVRRGAAEPPRTATEAALATIWEDLLGVPEVGVDDDFFELGGHSLLAARLVARIEEVFRTILPLRSLFEAPTVARLATLIEESSWADIPEPLPRDSDRVEIEL